MRIHDDRTSSESNDRVSASGASRLLAWLGVAGGVGILLYVASLYFPSGTQTSKPVTTTESVVAEPQDVVEQPSIEATKVSALQPFVKSSIQKELKLNNPSADGWDSEVVNEQAAKLLKKLGNEIASITGSETTPAKGSILAGDIRSSILRPTQASSIYDDAMFKVTRARKSLPASSTLATTVLGLVEPWKGHGASPRSSFKVIRVDATEQAADLKVKFQLDGPTTDGFTQLNCVWNCIFERPNLDELRLREITLQDFEEIQRRGASALLTDCTQQVCGDLEAYQKQFAHGIDHWRDSLDWRLGLDVAGPHGLAIGDVNGDGLDDLFICEPGGLPNRLLVQSVDGTVRDLSRQSGVDLLEPGTSALFLDLDNDADQDLVLTSGRFVVFCENDTTNSATTFQLRSIVTLDGIARSICAADYDNDGLLDVYVCSYINRDVALSDVGLGMPMPYHDANNGPANYLLRNESKLQFRDVTKDVGLDANNQRFSYAASWEDYDLDGDMDLYVANDFGRNNLYQSQNGRFTDVAATAGVEDVATGMSVSWGDYNRDGRPDLYIGNMFSTAGNRIMYQRQFQQGTDGSTKATFQRLARGKLDVQEQRRRNLPRRQRGAWRHLWALGLGLDVRGPQQRRVRGRSGGQWDDHQQGRQC